MLRRARDAARGPAGLGQSQADARSSTSCARLLLRDHGRLQVSLLSAAVVGFSAQINELIVRLFGLGRSGDGCRPRRSWIPSSCAATSTGIDKQPVDGVGDGIERSGHRGKVPESGEGLLTVEPDLQHNAPARFSPVPVLGTVRQGSLDKQLAMRPAPIRGRRDRAAFNLDGEPEFHAHKVPRSRRDGVPVEGPELMDSSELVPIVRTYCAIVILVSQRNPAGRPRAAWGLDLQQAGKLTSDGTRHRRRVNSDAGVYLNNRSVERRCPASIGPFIAQRFSMDFVTFSLPLMCSLYQHWCRTGAEDLNDRAAQILEPIDGFWPPVHFEDC